VCPRIRLCAGKEWTIITYRLLRRPFQVARCREVGRVAAGKKEGCTLSAPVSQQSMHRPARVGNLPASPSTQLPRHHLPIICQWSQKTSSLFWRGPQCCRASKQPCFTCSSRNSIKEALEERCTSRADQTLKRYIAKMLADNKIDSLDTHLEQFKLNNQTSQNDLQVQYKISPLAGLRLTRPRTFLKNMAHCYLTTSL
jgi:hypothetical protein